MADKIRVEIVSPEKLLLSEEVRSVSVPGQEGYLTVLANHAPLMTTLKPGFVTVRDISGSARSFYVRGGFADVSPAGVSILAEEARTGADFELAEIEEAILAAEQELSGAQTPEARSLAQARLDGWRNLVIDAQNSGPAVQQ